MSRKNVTFHNFSPILVSFSMQINIYVSKNFVWDISKHINSLNWAKSLQLRTFRCPKKVWWRSETLDSAIWCKNVWQNLDIKMNVEENVRFTIGFVIVWGFRNIYYMTQKNVSSPRYFNFPEDYHLFFKKLWEKLFGGTVPPNYTLFGGTLLPNNTQSYVILRNTFWPS